MKQKLWTRDFTIITVGSMVSLLGSTLSSFAMNLMVLDRTESTLLFALYNILYTLPMVLSPVLAGPFLDRFSRKRTIAALDFITSGLFLIMSLYLAIFPFSFIFFAAMNILLGAIGGVYSVAYQSFYPLTVTEGNMQRAYAVDSTLESLAAFMVPVSALIYNTFGLVPLFAANTVTYFLAALMETQLRTEEKYTSRESEYSGVRRFVSDFRDGIAYLRGDRGLMSIAVYFFFSSLAGGVGYVVALPWLRENFANGEYIYSMVWLMGDIARVISGVVFYKLRIPARYKYAIALTVYVATCVLEAAYLYVPVPVMAVMCFTTGLLGMASYNIRISATQCYVPDEKKGRFNGAFGTLSTVGQLFGQGAGGALAAVMAKRPIIVLANGICLLAAIIFIGGSKKAVSAVYSTEK